MHDEERLVPCKQGKHLFSFAEQGIKSSHQRLTLFLTWAPSYSYTLLHRASATRRQLGSEQPARKNTNHSDTDATSQQTLLAQLPIEKAGLKKAELSKRSKCAKHAQQQPQALLLDRRPTIQIPQAGSEILLSSTKSTALDQEPARIICGKFQPLQQHHLQDREDRSTYESSLLKQQKTIATPRVCGRSHSVKSRPNLAQYHPPPPISSSKNTTALGQAPRATSSINPAQPPNPGHILRANSQKSQPNLHHDDGSPVGENYTIPSRRKPSYRQPGLESRPRGRSPASSPVGEHSRPRRTRFFPSIGSASTGRVGGGRGGGLADEERKGGINAAGRRRREACP